MIKIPVNKCFLSTAGLLCIFFLGCVPGICFNNYKNSELQYLNNFRTYFNSRRIIKGFGNIEISLNGERHRGDFELIQGDENRFNATIYSSFGSIIGTIIVQNDTGIISFQGRKYSLSMDNYLDTLGFLWCRNLKMKDLVSIISGVIPSELIDRNFIPENCKKIGFDKVFMYSCESNHVYLNFSSRLDRLKRITLDYSSNGNPFFIINSHFLKGVPQLITLKADDRNYFQIEYDKIIAQ